MKQSKRKQGLFKRLAALYDDMDRQYRATAGAAGFSCQGCEQNCCVSYFQHHTYVEWSYLWRGMLELPKERQEYFVRRAQENVEQCNFALSQGLRPRVMCPLNDDGLCQLYNHRLMICRLHGVAHTFPGKDGQLAAYPGCFRFQAAVEDQETPPIMDRTPLYRELANLEMEHLTRVAGKKQRPAKVQMTLSEMLVYGPPRF